MMCTCANNKDSCNGDSDRSLILEGNDELPDLQVRVVSWGYSCTSKHFPGVYASVSSAYGWIKKEVCEKSSFPPVEFDCDEPSHDLNPIFKMNKNKGCHIDDGAVGSHHAYEYDLFFKQTFKSCTAKCIKFDQSVMVLSTILT